MIEQDFQKYLVVSEEVLLWAATLGKLVPYAYAALNHISDPIHQVVSFP